MFTLLFLCHDLDISQIKINVKFKKTPTLAKPQRGGRQVLPVIIIKPTSSYRMKELTLTGYWIGTSLTSGRGREKQILTNIGKRWDKYPNPCSLSLVLVRMLKN